MIGDSNDETSFPHKLLLTDTQVTLLQMVYFRLFKSLTKELFMAG